MATLLMAAVITGMHYTGMAAASVPEGAVCLSTAGLGGRGLTTLLVLSTSMPALTLLTSLHSNALKYTRQQAHPVIEVGCRDEHGAHVIYVKDNGTGFDTARQRQAVGRVPAPAPDCASSRAWLTLPAWRA